MGFFDFLTGTKRPDPSIVAVTADEIKKRLLALNRESAPWQVRDGSAEGYDIIAEWKIVNAKWYEIFAKAGLSRTFKVCLKFDEAAHTTKAVDKELSIEWQAGVPTLSLSASAFRGQKTEMSFGTAYAFKEDGGYGKVYNYRFDTRELKKPLQEAVLSGGWIYKNGL